MSTGNQAIVKTRSGQLEGIVQNGIFAFMGIPYAAAPVGALRWMPPQPVRPWSGLRPAKQYGAISLQNVMAAPINGGYLVKQSFVARSRYLTTGYLL